MDHDIIVLLDHSDHTFTLKLKTSSSYNDFKAKLEKNGLNPMRVTSPTFSIPDNMLMLMKVYKLCVVNMKVMCTTEVQQEGFHISSSMSSMNNGLNGEYYAQSNSTPLLDVGWRRSDKELLYSSWRHIIKNVGHTFKGGAADFKIELAKYSLEVGFKFSYKRNNKRCVSAVCANKDSHGCTWSISASVSTGNGWFNIRNLQNDHSCPLLVQSSKRLCSTLISLFIVDKVRHDPTISTTDVIDHFDIDYKMVVEYQMAWRTVEKAVLMCT